MLVTSNRVVLFSLQGCTHCDELKKTLTEENIGFDDIDIENSPNISEAWKNIIKVTGNNIVPTLIVKDEIGEEGEIYSPNIDFNSVDEIIKIVKDKIK